MDEADLFFSEINMEEANDDDQERVAVALAAIAVGLELLHQDNIRHRNPSRLYLT